MKKKLYWGYGSNLCHAHMKIRCPRAKPLRPLTVLDARLVFRGVADVEHAPGHRVPGGLWQITDDCEARLDRYEGVSFGLYRKSYLTTKEGERVLFYQMNDPGIMPPADYYLDVIREGYADFGLDPSHLDAAVEHAVEQERVTPRLRRRRDAGRIGAAT